MISTLDIAYNLAKIEIKNKYKKSFLGFIWYLVQPLAMLTVYTLFFGIIFKAKWSNGSGGTGEFALMVFSGLIFLNYINELMSSSADAIISKPNYVKKMKFPIYVLPLVQVLICLFNLLISFIVWLIFFYLVMNYIEVKLLLSIFLIPPLLLFGAGLSLIISSMTVYIQDLKQLIPLVGQVLLFLSPVFYSSKNASTFVNSILQFNPISYYIDILRGLSGIEIVVDGQVWLNCYFFSVIVFTLGIFVYKKLEIGFSDVL